MIPVNSLVLPENPVRASVPEQLRVFREITVFYGKARGTSNSTENQFALDEPALEHRYAECKLYLKRAGFPCFLGARWRSR